MEKKLNSLKSQNRSKGSQAEALAETYCISLGYTLIGKNFYIRGGELDLVFLSPKSCVVFVEVRSASKVGLFLTQGIRAKKKECLRRSAYIFLRRHSWFAKFPRRFDVIWVRDGKIEHWKNVWVL